MVPDKLQKVLTAKIHIRALIYKNKDLPASNPTKYDFYANAERALAEAERRKAQAETAFNRR